MSHTRDSKTDMVLWKEAIKDGTLYNGIGIDDLFSSTRVELRTATNVKNHRILQTLFIIGLLVFIYLELVTFYNFYPEPESLWHVLLWAIGVNVAVAVIWYATIQLGKTYRQIMIIAVILIYIAFLIQNIKYEEGYSRVTQEFLNKIFTVNYAFAPSDLMLFFIPYLIGRGIGISKGKKSQLNRF